VAEGPRLLGAALDARADIEAVFVAGDAAGDLELDSLLQRAAAAGVRVFDLAPGVLERVADTVTPQPVLSVVRMPSATLDDVAGADFVVVCAGVRDPGNSGAIIRAADASGAGAVVCCEGTADPFNPKAVRASAGSVLHVPVVRGAIALEVLAALGRRGIRRLAAATRDGSNPENVDLVAPVALVFGNEASGLPGSLRTEIDEQVTIPMSGQAESLNVSLAAAVLCFEVRRQRSNLRAVEQA